MKVRSTARNNILHIKTTYTTVHVTKYHRMFPLLLLSLVLQLVCGDDGAQTHKYPGYPTTSPIEITSVGFPQYSVVSNAIHNYSFEYTDHSRYVRIVFSDFFIHSNCVLKIYDGTKEGSVSIWTSGMRTPVFQSSGNHLSVVFKCTEETNKYQYDYKGWRAVVTFVKEHRDTSTDIPSTGLCPEIHDSTLWLHIDKAQFSGRHEPNISCTWMIDTLPKYLAVIMPSQAPKLKLTVNQGTSSVDPYLTPRHQVTGDTVYDVYSGKQFYVHLQGILPAGKSFKLAYDTSESSAKEKASSLGSGTYPYRCPQKDCARDYGSSNGCRKYWQSCQGKDPICDNIAYSTPCGVTSQCYADPADVCDGFSDCYNDADELCPESVLVRPVRNINDNYQGPDQDMNTLEKNREYYNNKGARDSEPSEGMSGNTRMLLIVLCLVAVGMVSCTTYICYAKAHVCECSCDDIMDNCLCECICDHLSEVRSECAQMFCTQKQTTRRTETREPPRQEVADRLLSVNTEAPTAAAESNSTNQVEVELSEIPDIEVSAPPTAPPEFSNRPVAPPAYSTLGTFTDSTPSPNPSDDVAPPSYEQALDRIQRANDQPYSPPPTYNEVMDETDV